MWCSAGYRAGHFNATKKGIKMDIQEFINNINPQLHQVLRQSLELGRLPDGRRFDAEEKALLLQALIAWEQNNIPEEQRIGYIEKPQCASERNIFKDSVAEQPLSIIDNKAPHNE